MKKPTKQQAEQAVKVLLEYIGEDTAREGLRNTPARIVKSYDELFSGYDFNVEEVLSKRFCDISEYNNVVLLKSINCTSLCEHHMLPFSGIVDIAYIPDGVVVGISKLARLVDVFARRLQIQKRMTANIATALQTYLKPQGVAISYALWNHLILPVFTMIKLKSAGSFGKCLRESVMQIFGISPGNICLKITTKHIFNIYESSEVSQ